MNRRALLASGAAFALAAGPRVADAAPGADAVVRFRRVRPGDAAWPDAAAWQALNAQTGGQLIKVAAPLAACAAAPASAACGDLLRNLRNPYFIGDSVGLTQTLGWVDAWTSQPSAYAVAARHAADVSAAVNIARAHRLRLVVKGGGHSYLGTSNAADSLLIWTRPMNTITLHDAFVGAGCDGRAAPAPAVSLGAGVMWGQAYDAVTTKAGRYVQGGGCLTVGVAGLVQSGGFGSYSKGYGTAAAGLLEAEIVTADGVARIANACTHPDLFWAIKGGGGGSFGVVTRLTLRTHDLPGYFGAVQTRITAKSDAAFAKLVARTIAFAAEALLDPHWGEQMTFAGNTLAIHMVFQGLDQAQAAATWRPLFDWVGAAPLEYDMARPLVMAIPAQHLWDPRLLKSVPGLVRSDDRAGAPVGNIFWAGDGGQVGQMLHGYQSAWLPRALLAPARQADLAGAIVQAAGIWGVSLHFNKGLAGGTPETIAASADTATNPAVLDAFALAIIAGEEPPAYPGIAGHEPDVTAARRAARAIEAAMAPLRRLQPAPAAYLAESDFFQPDWRYAYWGRHHERLADVKKQYDPQGLFFVHHGIGSESWSEDGFTRVKG